MLNKKKIVSLFILLYIFVVSSERSLLAQERFVYNPGRNRDPFIPLLRPDGSPNPEVYAAGAFEELYLEGIAWDSEGSAIAILNGQLVKEGDQIGGIKVLKINPSGVQVLIDEETKTVPLKRK